MLRFLQQRSPRQQGFTLVELSVVLVIIGVLVGAILVGQDLIEAAKIRAQISQISELEAEISTFKQKYNCLPGDCANATSVFGSSYAGLPIYNGNGNGNIHSDTGGGIAYAEGDCLSGAAVPNTSDTSTEIAQLFHHLNASGIGSYDNKLTAAQSAQGVANPNSPTLPKDVFGNAIFVMCLNDSVGSITMYANSYNVSGLRNNMNGTAIIIGGSLDGFPLSAYATRVRYVMGYNFGSTLQLSPLRALQIDIKMDDAKPYTGQVGVIFECHGGTNSGAGTYPTTYESMTSTCNVSLAKKILR